MRSDTRTPLKNLNLKSTTEFGSRGLSGKAKFPLAGQIGQTFNYRNNLYSEFMNLFITLLCEDLIRFNRINL